MRTSGAAAGPRARAARPVGARGRGSDENTPCGRNGLCPYRLLVYPHERNVFLTSCPIQTLQNPDLQSDNVAVSMQMRAFAARRGRSVDTPYRTTHAL